MSEQIPRHLQGPDIRILKKRNETEELEKKVARAFAETNKREKAMAARLLKLEEANAALEKTVARLEKELGKQK